MNWWDRFLSADAGQIVFVPERTDKTIVEYVWGAGWLFTTEYFATSTGTQIPDSLANYDFH